MLVLSQHRQKINQFLVSHSRAAYRRSWLFLILGLVLLAGIFIYLGAPIMNGRPWDNALYLEGAWRIANGQLPHRDFYSCLGSLAYYVTWLGMKMSRPCVSATTYGNIVVMVVVGLAALAALRRRTSAFYAAILSLFLALLAVAPRPLGDAFDFTDYAMLYNRYGEAFIAILGAILFLPPYPGARRRWADWAEAALAGVLLTILIFCKVNYVLIGLAFFATACLLGYYSLGAALVSFLSGVLAFGVISAATHIPGSAIFRDYRISAGVTDAAHRISVFAVHGVENILYVPLLILLAWEISSRPGERKISPQNLWRPLFLLLFFFACGLFLMSTDSQKGEMPLLALAGLYGAEMVRRETVKGEESLLSTMRNVGVFLLLALFFLPTFFTDSKTLLFSAKDKAKSDWVSTPAIQSTHLSDFKFTTGGSRAYEMKDYMASVDDVVALLRRHADPNMRLTGWMFSDPFPMALGLVPAQGGLIDLGDASVVKKSKPPLSRLVGDANYVLTDKLGMERMQDAYGSEWDALHLELVEKTPYATLFRLPVNNPVLRAAP